MEAQHVLRPPLQAPLLRTSTLLGGTPVDARSGLSLGRAARPACLHVQAVERGCQHEHRGVQPPAQPVHTTSFARAPILERSPVALTS